MRRNERRMSDKDSEKLLQTAEWGVLSLTDGNEAYGVPINYVYVVEQNAIYAHCANVGRKIDFIRKGFRAAFTVVGAEKILAERYTTAYRSVMLEGVISLVCAEEEKKFALCKLCEKFAPNEKNHEEEIQKFWKGVSVLKFEIDSISGKQNE